MSENIEWSKDTERMFQGLRLLKLIEGELKHTNNHSIVCNGHCCSCDCDIDILIANPPNCVTMEQLTK